MKTKTILITTSLTMLLALGAGCSKEDSSSTSSTEGTSERAGTSMMKETETTARETTDQAVETAKETAATAAREAEAAATAAKESASQAVADTQAGLNQQAQTLIAKAKDLIASSNYAEAGETLKKLSEFRLTPEQQKTVDELKAQIQKALSGTDAGKAIGNLLGQPK
jgi:hypothetical protein